MKQKRFFSLLISIYIVLVSVLSPVTYTASAKGAGQTNVPAGSALLGEGYAATDSAVSGGPGAATDSAVSGGPGAATDSAISGEPGAATGSVIAGGSDAATDSALAGNATAKPDETAAELRLIYTTDIHGQVTDYDYQGGKNVPRGLNKVYTLIQEARSEVGDNYLTFDVGDSIMNYTTDYIQANDPAAVQPVYSAMAKVGYDAITLGNHEFDYGYDYLVEQLEGSGLMQKCVLSNVTSKVNGDYVLGKENTILEKKVTDNHGKVRTIKIGLFGVTPPCMSSRTEGLRSVVVSEDILEAARRETKILQEKGADIIIALAHTGFGTENPESRISSTAYAMSKIPGIDVILAGHQHVYFPNASKEEFYKYPGVDKETGLVNGKRLMILRDSCRALGVVDLHFAIGEDGKVSLKGSDYEIRKTTNKTKTDSTITSCMSQWDAKLKAYSWQYIGKLSGSDRWQNYTALLEDNEIIQTVHDAQMQYASYKIANDAPQYKDYPVVSMATYTKDGSAGSDNFADLSGSIYKGSLESFGSYNCHMYVYEVTGKQLREWVEWGASVYQTVNTSAKGNWDDMVIAEFVKKGKGDALLQSEFQNNWSRFFSFNGIEYTIDPSKEPRYNSTGDKINDTRRVTSLTYNGGEISDEQKFAVCSQQILVALDTEATQGIKKQIIIKSYDLLQNVVYSYLQQKALMGDMQVHVDSNWSLALPDNYSFIMIAGVNSESIVSKQDWYQGVVSSLGGYYYYHGIYHAPETDADTAGPNIVVSPLNKEETNDSVPFRIITNDKSGIKRVLIAQTAAGASDPVWSTEGSGTEAVEGGTAQISKNGVYSIYAEDMAGNATVETFAVTNIYPSILLKPTVNKVTNKTSKVTGVAEPNTKIHIISEPKMYTATVGVDGSFGVEIPLQKAGKALTAYISDNKGRASKVTNITVKRSGPNCPTISAVKNTGTSITGNCNDKNVRLYAIIGKNVYVSKSDGASYYKKSKGYDKKFKIKTVSIKINSKGGFIISIPNQYYGTVVKVRSVDKAGRISSVRKAKVEKAAPNRATIYANTTAEQYVFGRVPNDGVCTVSVKKGNGKTYYGKSDKNGYYAVKVGTLQMDTTLTVRAKKGSGAYSYPASRKVVSFTSMYAKYNNHKIKVNSVTDKTLYVKGKSPLKNSVLYLLVSGQYYTTKTDGSGAFSFRLKSRQKCNTPVYIVARTGSKALYSLYCGKVKLGAPIAPKIVGGLKRRTKTVTVQTSEACAVSLTVNKKKYKSKKTVYQKSTKAYRCTFRVKKLRSKQKVTAYASNAAGKTKGKTVKVR